MRTHLGEPKLPEAVQQGSVNGGLVVVSGPGVSMASTHSSLSTASDLRSATGREENATAESDTDPLRSLRAPSNSGGEPTSHKHASEASSSSAQRSIETANPGKPSQQSAVRDAARFNRSFGFHRGAVVTGASQGTSSSNHWVHGRCSNATRPNVPNMNPPPQSSHRLSGSSPRCIVGSGNITGASSRRRVPVPGSAPRPDAGSVRDTWLTNTSTSAVNIHDLSRVRAQPLPRREVPAQPKADPQQKKSSHSKKPRSPKPWDSPWRTDVQPPPTVAEETVESKPKDSENPVDKHENRNRPRFRPMGAVQQKKSGGRPPSPPRKTTMADPSAFSKNYLGEFSEKNKNKDSLPDADNCALWLTNLPPAVTENELLGCIRNAGRVWCTVINKPDNVKHFNAAAKVVFFTAEAAHRFMDRAAAHKLFVGGQLVRVTLNRIKHDETVPPNGKTKVEGGRQACRVLLITGDRHVLVNETTLTAWFERFFVFQVDEVRTLEQAGRRAVVEYRFGSYRAQAESGKKALEKERPAGLEKVEFGIDPCAGSGDATAAYAIAAQRIERRGI